MKDNFLQQIVKNISKGSKHEMDLLQEVSLDLLEYNNDKLNAAVDGKWINYLTIAIVRNKMNSNTCGFYRKFKRDEQELIDFGFDINSEYNTSGQESYNNEMKRMWDDDFQLKDTHNVVGIIEELINKLHWYDKEIAQMYWKLGPYNKVDGLRRDEGCKRDRSSYRRLEKITGIDHNAIALTINKVINQVRDEL